MGSPEIVVNGIRLFESEKCAFTLPANDKPFLHSGCGDGYLRFFQFGNDVKYIDINLPQLIVSTAK